MKRLRNHNNHGSIYRARRPLLPQVQPVTVDEGNGCRMVERIFTAWIYIRRRWHPVTVKTGEYRPRMGSPNSASRRRVCNYRRMQKRGLSMSYSKIHKLFNL